MKTLFRPASIVSAIFGCAAIVGAQNVIFTPKPYAPGNSPNAPRLTTTRYELNSYPRAFYSDADWFQQVVNVGTQQQPLYAVAGWISVGMNASQQRYRGSTGEPDLQDGAYALFGTLLFDAEWQLNPNLTYGFVDRNTGNPNGFNFDPDETERILVRLWFRKQGSLSTYANVSEIDPNDNTPPGVPYGRSVSLVGKGLSKRSDATGYNTRDDKPTAGWVEDGPLTFMDLTFTRTFLSSTLAVYTALDVSVPTSLVDVTSRANMPYSNFLNPNILTTSFGKAIGKSRVELARAWIIGPAPKKLEGTLSSADVPVAALAARTAAFTLWNTNNEAVEWDFPSVTVDPVTGAFKLGTLAANGSYDLVASAKGFLKKKLSVSLTGDLSGLSYSLIAGDADGDNRINNSDLKATEDYLGRSSLGDNWDMPNSQGIAPRDCDFNVDSKVDAADLAIVLSHFGAVGDY